MAKTGRSRDDYGYPINLRDRWKCRYCGFRGHDAITFRFFSVDHVKRKADGGSDDASNKVTACRPCNDYFNKSPNRFRSFREKRKAVREKLREEAAFFAEKVAPYLAKPRTASGGA